MKIQPNTKNDRISFIPESQIDYFYCGIIYSKMPGEISSTFTTDDREPKITRVVVTRDALMKKLTGF